MQKNGQIGGGQEVNTKRASAAQGVERDAAILKLRSTGAI